MQQEDWLAVVGTSDHCIEHEIAVIGIVNVELGKFCRHEVETRPSVA